MSLTAAAIRLMAEKGLSSLDIAEIADAMEPVATSGAARQARYRERGGGKIPQELRLEVFERDGWACLDCGADENLCCDHVIPVSKDGETSIENLQTLCIPCNSRKKDRIRKRDVRRVRGKSVESPRTKESTPPKEYIQTPHAKKITPLTPQFDFVGIWNEMAVSAGVHTCKALSRQRKAALRARLDEVGETEMRRAILTVGQSAFCKGDNDRGWKAGPDFVLQEKTLTKLLEGQYSNFKAATSPADDRQAFLQRKYGSC